MSIPEGAFRRVAAIVLDEFDPVRRNIAELISRYSSGISCRRQVVDVVSGVVRNRFLIDRIIEAVSGRKIAKISPSVLNIIRVGIYEIVFTSSSADYAIVNEAVNLARISSRRASGFVNAVLRNAVRAIEDKSVNFADSDKAKTVPVSVDSGCQFKRAFLPDARVFPAEYLSVVFSLPLWLVKRWLKEFGFDRTVGICFGSNRRPSMYARVNTLKISVEQLYDRFLSAGFTCSLTSEPDVIKLCGVGDVSSLSAFKQGLFVIQDITAGKAVKLLSPEPGSCVLDICAAPGAKTIQLAQLMGDSGLVIATDVDAQRLKKVEQNISRLSLTSVRTVSYALLPATAGDIGFFDSILVDAPCSNTAVMARRSEVRYRVSEAALASIGKLQLELLCSVVGLLRPRGKLCYSTCSIVASENRGIVDAFLSRHSDFRLDCSRTVLPSALREDCDGGYAAVMCR